MQRHEWLSLAQKVPVGQSRRFYHGAESRPNLVVYNNPTSYSAWCHSCHTYGYKPKDVLQPVIEAPKLQKWLNHADCCSLTELASKHPSKFRQVVLLLHKKGMSIPLLQSCNPCYNLTDCRLVLQCGDAYIGRDMTGQSSAKWFHYYSQKPMDFLYLQGENKYSTREPIVLTEDLFSAMKVQQYTGLSALCCFGTHVSDAIVGFLTYPNSNYYPILAFDGDKAGWRATRDASKRLGIRGVPYTTVKIPDDKDPKDLSPIELNELFQGVTYEEAL